MKEMMIEGKLIRLVEVSENDSISILKLRNNPAISKYLSGTSEITSEQQREWIKLNKVKSDGFYWTIKDGINQFFGTISLYNVIDRKAEFGRYICTNSIYAIEAELLILEFGFKHMGLDEIYCRTVINNEKVWKQHYKFGFEDQSFEELPQKKFTLKRQVLNKVMFDHFDYSNIQILLERFS